MRVLIGGLVHESSTFAAQVLGNTGLARFTVTAPEDLVATFARTNSTVGGYLDACREHGVEVVAATHARAEPGSSVDPAAWTALRDDLLTAVRSSPGVAVVLLDLHGAGVVAPHRSLDLDVATAVREVAPRAVIATSMDLHANVDARFLDVVDVVVGFQEYPHTDMAARAAIAADVAIRAAQGRCAPHSVVVRLPMQMPPSPTTHGAGMALRALAVEMEGRPGILACTPFHGFPYADTEQAATSVVVVSDGQRDLASDAAEEVAEWIWRRREDFRPDLLEPWAALARAVSSPVKPVVIGDAGDNPGGGAPGDETGLLAELLELGVKACVATIHDPVVVRAAVEAGVGARIEVALGGRHGSSDAAPLRVHGTVRCITDGSVVYRRMRRGVRCEFGTSVRLSVGEVDIVVSSDRRQVVDPEILVLHGVDPRRYDVVVVKSAFHFHAGFADLGGLTLTVDTPGLTTRAIDTLPGRTTSGSRWPMTPDARRPASNG